MSPAEVTTSSLAYLNTYERYIATITATAMQKPIVMQNAMLTPFLQSFLPWDFFVS
jgi:hypothetical protein